MIRRKIVLRFITGTDEANNYRYKKKTIRNIRPELPDEQLIEFVTRYCSLTAYPLAEAVVVDERLLVLEKEEELIEVIPQEEQEALFLREGEQTTEIGVTNASFKEGEETFKTNEEFLIPLTESEKPSEPDLRQTTKTAKEKNFPKDTQGSRSKKNEPLQKAAPVSLTQNQALCKQGISDNKTSIVKGKKKTDIKKQSPPLKADYENLEPIAKNTLLAKKAADLEEEVIEIVLDAGQAFSVEALIELIEKSEMGSISERKLPFKKGQPLPVLQFSKQEADLDLLMVDEILSQSLIEPVKKRMPPPVGKKTRPKKKKR